MKVAANVIIALTAVACLAALAVGVYPGVLNSLFIPVMLLAFFGMVGLAVVATILVAAAASRKDDIRAWRVPWRRVGIVVCLLMGTYVLLKFYVPRRIAFAMCREAFERVLPQATTTTTTTTSAGVPLNRRLGIFDVDEYAADPRGGVYFRTHVHPDGFGPDRMSYGFAYQPNPDGTPFGAASYLTRPLGGGWFWFRASDDW